MNGLPLGVLEGIGTQEILLLVAFGIPGIVVAALVVFLLTRRAKELKKCPHCAEWIKPEAVVCRFCGRDVG